MVSLCLPTSFGVQSTVKVLSPLSATLAGILRLDGDSIVQVSSPTPASGGHSTVKAFSCPTIGSSIPGEQRRFIRINLKIYSLLLFVHIHFIYIQKLQYIACSSVFD